MILIIFYGTWLTFSVKKMQWKLKQTQTMYSSQSANEEMLVTSIQMYNVVSLELQARMYDLTYALCNNSYSARSFLFCSSIHSTPSTSWDKPTTRTALWGLMYYSIDGHVTPAANSKYMYRHHGCRKKNWYLRPKKKNVIKNIGIQKWANNKVQRNKNEASWIFCINCYVWRQEHEDLLAINCFARYFAWTNENDTIRHWTHNHIISVSHF